jgi:hypothetical protein
MAADRRHKQEPGNLLASHTAAELPGSMLVLAGCRLGGSKRPSRARSLLPTALLLVARDRVNIRGRSIQRGDRRAVVVSMAEVAAQRDGATHYARRGGRPRRLGQLSLDRAPTALIPPQAPRCERLTAPAAQPRGGGPNGRPPRSRASYSERFRTEVRVGSTDWGRRWRAHSRARLNSRRLAGRTRLNAVRGRRACSQSVGTYRPR